jgi:hypothetical protein
MTTNLKCQLDDIRKIIGHLGQDYFHDFGATRADKFYVYEIINHPGKKLLDGGYFSDESKMSILEIEIEKTIDILKMIYPNINLDNIFDPSSFSPSSITPYYTAQYPSNTYYTAQIPSIVQKTQSLSDPISSVSGPKQIGGVPYYHKNKWKKDNVKEEEIKKEIDKQREKKDRELALKFQEEERKSRFSRANRGIPVLPSNFESKCEKWDDSLDHYFTLNNNAYQENETRKTNLNTKITDKTNHENFIDIINEIGVFYKKTEILELIENIFTTFDPYNHIIFKHYYDQIIKKSTFKNYINKKRSLEQLKYSIALGYNEFGTTPSLEPNQKKKVKNFNKNIINYWGKILGNCSSGSYEKELQNKLNGTNFKDDKLKELFMNGPGKTIQPHTLQGRQTVQNAAASIPTNPPWDNKNTWQDIQKLSNNSCSIKYAHAVSLLNNPPGKPPCFPSTSLDGSSGCKTVDNNEVFDISINDGQNEYMRFRLQINGNVFSIHFDIRNPDNKDEVFLSYEYINAILSNPLHSQMYFNQTGFYTDSGHLLFNNNGRSGITLGLIVKLFCLILVNNPTLNPWEDVGFTANRGLFASIFFLKECGDLFQELFACKKSITDDHHIYLTNDIPSSLRYLLFMSLFKNSNGWGGYLHNSNKGIDMIIGLFYNQSQSGGKKKNTLKKKTRRKKRIRRKI